MSETKLIAVFGKMKPLPMPSPPGTSQRLTIERNGIEMEMPYHSQVAVVDMEAQKVFNLSPVNGVVVFDTLRWPHGGAELTLLETAKAVRQVCENVARRLYECSVKFFHDNAESSVEDVLKFATLAIEDGGKENASAYWAKVSGHDAEVEAEQLKPAGRKGK